MWEWQGKAITNGSSLRKVVAPVSSGQFPGENGRADYTTDSMERNPSPLL